MKIEKDFKEFLESLNRRGVKYLIVGGFAFSYYARPRFTKDLDVFVEPSEDNAGRLVEALADFGFESMGLKKEDFLTPRRIVQLGYPPMRIDIVTSLSGVDFARAWEGRTNGSYGDCPVFFISRDDLMANKAAAGRPQDIADLELLRKL
jgi:predicted nucleotidyltransferase